MMNSRARRLESYSRDGKHPRPINGNRATPTVTLSHSRCDPLYHVRLLDRDTLRCKGIKIRSSRSWISCFNTPNGGLEVPYIDGLGRFTGHTLYKWSCDPRSLIATTVSTIAHRAMVYARRHNKRYIVNRFSKAILGAAAYYAISKNSHFWDRFLYFCRNLQERGRLIHRLRLFFSSKWDDNKRFVISQVIFQTNWLLFRALRPRDKSHFFGRVKHTIWSNPESGPDPIEVTNCVREIAYAICSI
jgi:hypothetical protein